MLKNVIIGLVFGTVASCLSYAYALSNDFAKQANSEMSSAIFGILNLPAIAMFFLIQFDSTTFFLVLVFIQWFLLGFGASFLFNALKGLRTYPDKS